MRGFGHVGDHSHILDASREWDGWSEEEERVSLGNRWWERDRMDRVHGGGGRHKT